MRRSPDNINEAYCAAFEGCVATLPGRNAGWLSTMRAEAMREFSDVGFPTRKQEPWRYTNMDPLQKKHFAVAAVEAGVVESGTSGGPSITIVNGRVAKIEADLALRGIKIRSFREMLNSEPDKMKNLLATKDETGTGLLNRAFMSDGVVLEIDAGFDPSATIEIDYQTNASEPTAHHIRNLFLLATGARATVVENFSGQGPYWNNLVTNINLAEAAGLTQIVHQDEGLEALHIGLRRARLDAGSRLESFVLSTGGQVARDELHLDFAGEGASANAGGVFLAGERQCRDTYILTDHRVPGTTSNQYFKGILAGRARGAFQGRIVVQEGAAGTDASQTCNNLILDRGAEANAKPELLIHTDDVKCSHGATVGELDADALFYLMARGLSPEQARTILVEAFAADALKMINDEARRAPLESAIEHWMTGRSKKGEKQ